MRPGLFGGFWRNTKAPTGANGPRLKAGVTTQG